jgi:hypothetical protein
MIVSNNISTFGPHGLPQRVVEIRIERRHRRHAVEAAQVQPLSCEVHRQRLCFRVREHPPHLLFEDRRLLEVPLLRHLQQRPVRRTAPQEEGETRCEFGIADAVGLPCRDTRRRLFDAIDELRRRQHAGKHGLHAQLEILLATPQAIELHERLDVRRAHWPPEGAGRDVLDDTARACFFFGRPGGHADEQLASAGRAGGVPRIEGPLDADRADMRKKGIARRRAGLNGRTAEVFVEIEQRRVLRGEEGHADGVAAGGHMRAHAHRRTLAEERLRPVLPCAHRRLQMAAALGRGRPSLRRSSRQARAGRRRGGIRAARMAPNRTQRASCCRRRSAWP